MITHVAHALSTGDAEAVARILVEHYTDRETAELFAAALVDAFSRPH